MNIWRHTTRAILGLICVIAAAILVWDFPHLVGGRPGSSADLVRRILGVAGVSGILWFAGMLLFMAGWRECSERRRNGRAL